MSISVDFSYPFFEFNFPNQALPLLKRHLTVAAAVVEQLSQKDGQKGSQKDPSKPQHTQRRLQKSRRDLFSVHPSAKSYRVPLGFWARLQEKLGPANLHLAPGNQQLVDDRLKTRNQFFHRTREQLEAQVASLLESYRNNPVAIVCRNRKDRDRMERFVEELSDIAPLVRGCPSPYPSGPKVSPFSTYEGSLLSALDWDVLIFLEPDLATNQHGQDAIASFRRWTKTGKPALIVMRDQQQLPAWQELMLEGTFGPVNHVETAIWRRQPFIYEIQIPVSPVVIAANASALEAKRAQIWHHDKTNRWIASFVDPTNPSSDGLGGVASELDLHDPSVSILVESPEHAEALHKLLPTWTIRSFSGEPFPDPAGNQSIVTETFAARHGVATKVVVIANQSLQPPQVRTDLRFEDLPPVWIDLSNSTSLGVTNRQSRRRYFLQHEYPVSNFEERGPIKCADKRRPGLTTAL